MESLHSQHRQTSLKYLGFFPVAFDQACLRLSSIYQTAKNQAGPLKPGVEDVELLLKRVLQPVFRIVGNSFNELLNSVDQKVDQKLKAVEESVPAFFAPAASRALQMFLPPVAEAPVSEGNSTANDGSTFTGMGSYNSFKKYIVSPPLSEVMGMVVARALYSAELFNQVASTLRERRVPLAAYIPDIPIHVVEKYLKAASQHGQSCEWYECDRTC